MLQSEYNLSLLLLFKGQRVTKRSLGEMEEEFLQAMQVCLHCVIRPILCITKKCRILINLSCFPVYSIELKNLLITL